jgi:hypothetical protein
VLDRTEDRIGEQLSLNSRALASAQRLIEEHENEIREAWEAHFGS